MLTILAALAAAGAAPAGPIYLQCDALQRGQPVRYDITLYEPLSMVEWSGATARRRDAAQFTADAVYFQTFRISRVNLSMIRRYSNVMGDGIETEAGQCRKITPPSRAF